MADQDQELSAQAELMTCLQASQQRQELAEVKRQENNREKLAEVGKLLMAFPGEKLGPDEQKLRGEAFIAGLGSFDPSDVRIACSWWMQGKNGDGNENYAFAPSVPQLARLAYKAKNQFCVPDSGRYPKFGPDRPAPKVLKTEEERGEFVEAVMANLKFTGSESCPQKMEMTPDLEAIDEMKKRYAELRAEQYKAAQKDLEREAVEALKRRDSQQPETKQAAE